MTELDKVKFGVIVFPGTNCERETVRVLQNVLGQRADLIWHEETEIAQYDALILPGGFSYGDHLRTGAIARFAPVMGQVEELAKKGKPVIGICNGFQILCEAGLLPGTLLKNQDLKFKSKWVNARVENSSIFTRECRPGQIIRMPMAHGEGNFYALPDVLQSIEEKGQVILRYSSADGEITPKYNPNGSLNNIAGIKSEQGNVIGLMPHPERASELELGSDDGKYLFLSLIRSIEETRN